jgi:hypothetical protein
MAELAWANTGWMVFAAVAVILFLILFAVCLQVLQRVPLFQGNSAKVLAVCVALLCLVGLGRMFTGFKKDTSGSGWDVILLPYAALALAILFGLILLWAARLRGKEKEDFHDRQRFRDDRGQSE